MHIISCICSDKIISFMLVFEHELLRPTEAAVNSVAYDKSYDKFSFPTVLITQ